MTAQKPASIDRRGFVKGAGAAVVASSIAASAAHADVPETWDYEADAVVIGIGAAGALAACQAYDDGASVIVLEKAPQEESGGATRLFAGFMTIENYAQDPDKAWRHMKGIFSKDVIEARVDAYFNCEDWLLDNEIEGIEFGSWGAEEGYYHPNGGWKLYPQFQQKVLDRDIQVLFSTPATELIQDPETGEVLGVKALQDGKPIAVKAAKGVVLATGSYSSNPEMMAQFHYPSVNIFSFDSPYNTGDGFYMAAKAGAKLGGMWPESAELEDLALTAASKEVGTGVMYCHPRAENASHIFVNKDGQRFMDETTHIAHNRSRLPFMEWDPDQDDYRNNPFWMVFDEAMLNSMRLAQFGETEAIYENYGTEIRMTYNGVFKVYPWSDDNQAELAKGWIFKGDTLEELAAAMTAVNGFGDTVTVDPQGLAQTVAAYNELCRAGEDTDFGRNPDYLHPIENGPFYAVELSSASMYGYAGPTVDAENRVLNVAGEPIPRLYAAGQVTLTLDPMSCVPTAMTAGLECGSSVAGLERWDQ